jgi:hypothetical protein
MVTVKVGACFHRASIPWFLVTGKMKKSDPGLPVPICSSRPLHMLFPLLGTNLQKVCSSVHLTRPGRPYFWKPSLILLAKHTPLLLGALDIWNRIFLVITLMFCAFVFLRL